MAKQAAKKKKVVAVEFGNSVDVAWHPELPQSALIDALGFAHEVGFLFASQPWRLAESSVRDLENTFGYSPAGGWKRLISLAAGQKWFEATEDKFVPAISCAEIEAMTAEEFQIQLVESFTRQLCPPQTMAGILVALELHPMWGLRVVHDVRSASFRSIRAISPNIFRIRAINANVEILDSVGGPERTKNLVHTIHFDWTLIIGVTFRAILHERWRRPFAASRHTNENIAPNTITITRTFNRR